MKRSTNRIITTHTGSLPRPADLLELMRPKENGQAYDHEKLATRVRSAVAEVVKLQADNGVDVVSDGEEGKPGFFNYVKNRLNGMEGWATTPAPARASEFPDFQAWRAQQGRVAAPLKPGRPELTGALSWKDLAAVQTDVDNLKAAVKNVKVEEAFIPSASIGIIAQRISNHYYPSYEKYVEAIANVMKDEYKTIANGGFVLQIDAPEVPMDRALPEFWGKPLPEYHKRMGLWHDALNHALSGIPAEQVRFHVCWGNGEAPHDTDTPLKDIIKEVLKVNAGAFSVEASNPRHAHEWKLWKETKLPAGKIIIPGTIDSVTNFVEHPEIVADRIMLYANIVGRENVIAGTDCGFGTGATSNTIYGPVVWGKMRSLSAGAKLATEQLWKE